MKDVNSCPSTLMEGFKTYSRNSIYSLSHPTISSNNTVLSFKIL